MAVPRLLSAAAVVLVALAPGAVAPSWSEYASSYARDTVCAMAPDLCGDDGCPWHPDWLRRAEDAGRARVFGQDHAVRLVLDAMRVHYASGRPRRKALVVSVHGPTGVGKSLFHSVLAEAIFARRTDRGRPVGALVIGAVHYRDPARAFEYEEELRARLSAHLRRCRAGLIVVEELQLLPPAAAAVFAPLFDAPADPSEAADFSNFTFVLTSNLGAELISQRAYAAGGPARVDLHALQDDLQAALDVAANSTAFTRRVDLVVPFYPFGRAQLAQVAERLLENLREELAPAFEAGRALRWDPRAAEALLARLAWEGEGAESQFARYGVQTLVGKFDMLVHGPVRRHVDEALRACGPGAPARVPHDIRVAVRPGAPGAADSIEVVNEAGGER